MAANKQKPGLDGNLTTAQLSEWVARLEDELSRRNPVIDCAIDLVNSGDDGWPLAYARLADAVRRYYGRLSKVPMKAGKAKDFYPAVEK